MGIKESFRIGLHACKKEILAANQKMSSIFLTWFNSFSFFISLFTSFFSFNFSHFFNSTIKFKIKHTFFIIFQNSIFPFFFFYSFQNSTRSSLESNKKWCLQLALFAHFWKTKMVQRQRHILSKNNNSFFFQIVVTKLWVDTFERNRDEKERRYFKHDTPNGIVLIKERQYSRLGTLNGIVLNKKRQYFGLGTPNGIVLNKKDNTSGLVPRTESSMIWIGGQKYPGLSSDSIQPESSILKINLIPWLIPRLNLFWKLDLENEFYTSAYPEARLILLKFWKQIRYPGLSRDSIHFV